MHTLARPRAIATPNIPDSSRVSRETFPARAQDAADGPPPARAGSWGLPAPAGAYAAVTAWQSATAWFDAVMDVLSTPYGESARRKARVAPATLLRVAYADSKAADQPTGRGVTTAHDTVALQLGMSGKTVQRCRHLLEALGFAVTVAEGRYLFDHERRLAHAKHGGRQLRAASTRALTMPRDYAPPARASDVDPLPVENVQLPTRRGVNSSLIVKKRSPRRAHPRAQKDTASRRPADMTIRRETPPSAARPIDVQRLAAGLCAAMSWLDRATSHIGKLCDALAAQGLVGRGWTAESLQAAMQRRRLELGIKLADVDEQRDPFAYFVWLLRATIPHGSPAPAQLLQDESRRRAERQAADAAREAARRAQIRAEAAAIDAVIANMRHSHPAHPPARRRSSPPPRSAR
jgi:hypothetical protein